MDFLKSYQNIVANVSVVGQYEERRALLGRQLAGGLPDRRLR